MPQKSFLLTLQQRLPGDAFPWTVAALMRDPLIWEALHGDLGIIALKALGDNPTNWHPAALAALALKTSEDSRLDTLPLPPAHFGEAAHLARMLSRHREESGDWHDLTAFLTAEGHDIDAWRTALACVLAQSKDKDELLLALSRTEDGVEAALHALFCQPVPPEAHAAQFARLLHSLPAAQRPEILWQIHAARPDLAPHVAAQLDHQTTTPPYDTWQRAVQHLANGNPDGAHQALTQTWETLRRLNGDLASHHAMLAEQRGDTATALTAWEQAAASLPESPVITARLALALARVRRIEEAREALPEHPQHPALLVAAAHVWSESHPQTALQHAHQALQYSQQLPDDLLRVAAEVLLRLNAPHSAFQAASQLARRRPADVQTLDLVTTTALQAQTWEAATEHALLAHRIAPSPQRLRRLAQAQEAQGLLAEAMRHRDQLARSDDATPDDHLALARLAMRLGDLEKAHAIAENLLSQNPEDHRALTLLGQILMKEDKPEEAQRRLQQAIAQHPNDPAPYLILADLAAQTQGAEAALDVLQTAVHALPQEAELHYHLGMHLLQMQRPGHARPALETAHRLAPLRTDIALALAQTYLILGEAPQARDLLAPHYQRHPAPEVARVLAKAFLASEQPQEAARVLAPLAQTDQAAAADLLLYAQALLAAEITPERAVSALQSALEKLASAQDDIPLRPDILAALAQAHLANGDPQSALEAYRQALQTLPPGYPKRQRNIARGLAETALQLRRPEIALAAVEEALQQTPHHPHLHRLQAEAYQQLGFREQALDAAAEALRLEDNAPDAALWYARLAHAMGESEYAIAALESLPDDILHPPVILLRAEIYHALGRTQEAADLLQPLLEKPDELSPAWCAKTGEYLLQFGRPSQAVKCLQRATHAADAPVEWHLHLVQALQNDNAFDQAIEVAGKALERYTDQEAAHIDLHLAIIHSHIAQGQLKQAAAALQHALQSHPKAERLLAAAATLWRLLGAYSQAFAATQRYLAIKPQDMLMRARSAQLARALLRPKVAQKILQPDRVSNNEAVHPAAITEILATGAELALENSEEVAAAELLTVALEHQPDSPRLIALQARLTGRRIDAAEGRKQLETAIQKAPPLTEEEIPSPETIATWESIADTAIELRMWTQANEITRQLQRLCPRNPAAALRSARVAVLIAEAQHRCQAVEAQTHAPGEEALAEEAATQWQQALEAAANNLEQTPSPETYADHPALKRWYLRGLAAFQNQPPQALLLDTPAPGDVASLLDTHRRLKTQPEVFPQDHNNHPLVQLHFALLLETLPETDLGEALQAAEAARHARPHWAAAHFLVARLARRSGQLTLAAEAVTAALTLQSDEPRWHALAADIFRALRQDEKVQHHLTQALHLEPQHIPHYLTLAQFYLEANQFDNALETLQTALEIDAEQADVHLMLAQTYFQAEQFEQAVHHANRAIRLARDAEAPAMLRIRIALAQHDAATALQHAKRWLQDHPHHPEATIYAARALVDLGKPAEALQMVEETLPHAAEHMELNILQAELRRQVDGPQAAVKTWQALLSSRPNAPKLWLGLAEALAAARQRTPAREAAHKALRHADELDAQTLVRLHLLLGNIAREEGQLDQAVHHFEKAVRLAPRHLEALLKLGQVQHERQKYREALDIFTTAQRLAPQDSRPFYLAGLVYKAIKDYENAEKMFRQAAQRAPDDMRIRRQLAAVSVINIWQ